MIYVVLALVVIVVIVAVFVAGKVYGAKVEAAAVALALKTRSYATTETGKLYAAIVADIKNGEASLLARVKKAL